MMDRFSIFEDIAPEVSTVSGLTIYDRTLKLYDDYGWGKAKSVGLRDWVEPQKIK